MTEQTQPTDAALQSIIDDADAGPPTDKAWLCLECGRWTPWRHEEAHDHADGCKAPAIYAAKRDWKTRLKDYMANRGTPAGAGEPYGYVYTAQVAPIVGDERKVERTVFTRNKPPCNALAIYTTPQPTQAQAREIAELKAQLTATAKNAFEAMPHDIPLRMKDSICEETGWSGSMVSRMYTELRKAFTGEQYKANEDLDAALLEIERLRKNAERYQFLRDTCWLDTPLEHVICLQLNAKWDRAIDEAIDAAKEPQP